MQVATWGFAHVPNADEDDIREAAMLTGITNELLSRNSRNSSTDSRNSQKDTQQTTKTTQASWDIWLGAGIIIGIGATIAIIWIWRKRKKLRRVTMWCQRPRIALFTFCTGGFKNLMDISLGTNGSIGNNIMQWATVTGHTIGKTQQRRQRRRAFFEFFIDQITEI